MPCCASHLGGERGSVVICFSAEPQKLASAYWGSLGEARITGKRKGLLDVPSVICHSPFPWVRLEGLQ